MTLKEDEMQKAEKPQTEWWSHQIFPCMNYFKAHPIETILLMSLVALIVYQLIVGSPVMSPIIQRGGEGEGAAEAAAEGATGSSSSSFLGKVGSGVKKLITSPFKIVGASASGVKGALLGTKDEAGETVYKGLSGHIGDQLASGVGQPISSAWDKTEAFRNSPGEYIKGAIYYILEIAVIFVVFFPCMSLFLIIMVCYFFIRPYIKYIKKL
jgi:hypothetical protein